MAIKKKESTQATQKDASFMFEEGYLAINVAGKQLLSEFKMKDGIDRANLLNALNILIKETCK